ncbi:8658_t:CDS:1, partial [Paraglomus occultum]
MKYLKRKRSSTVQKSLNYVREYAYYEAKINAEHDTPLREKLVAEFE